MNYASFWRRLAALQADAWMLFLPAMLVWWLESDSKVAAFLLAVPLAALSPAYDIYFLGRCGQTPGKRIAGIRVLRVDGSAVGWRAAWLRSLVNIAFAVLAVASTCFALTRIADADYYVRGWLVQNSNLAAHTPEWLSWVPTAELVWAWSEILVMLFNRRRRALHDFLAGTVVVDDRTVSGATVAVVNIVALVANGLVLHAAAA